MVANKELHRQWALAGAAVRLREIHEELAEIHRAFPELRKGGRPTAVASSETAESKKRKFSARGKKAISDGMRKYWARRKAAAKAAAKTGGKTSGKSAQK